MEVRVRQNLSKQGHDKKHHTAGGQDDAKIMDTMKDQQGDQ